MAGAALVDQGVDEELLQRLRVGDRKTFTPFWSALQEGAG
jgi:hypothetical protein